MPSEATQQEINHAAGYARQNGAKTTEVERTKRVAEGLREKRMPKEAVLSLMLKEVPTEKYSQKDVEGAFGEETAKSTSTMRQIESILEKNYGKIPSETISSIILSLAQDFGPIIAKIAETADALYHREKFASEGNYLKKAEEIWFPLATKLDLGGYSWKIQDFGFRASNPNAFEKIKKIINKTREERERFVNDTVNEIKELFKGKLDAEVSGRPKSFRSIYDKMKKVPIPKMYDIYGVRVLCNKEKECYEALGYIHSKYEIIPEAFDDYISKPKSDGYKSIHTAVRRGNDTVEVQIRTWEHHMRIMASPYWNYKKLKKDEEFEKELSWERQLIEWQKSAGKESLVKKLGGKKIFVFTPKNEVIALPHGATAIDFAFAVHTDVGKKMEKAKVNGTYAPIETKLNNLDTVEILTAKKPQLKNAWLNFAITEKAKSKIKAHFGMKQPKKDASITATASFKKIKLAECCHPLPGEDVIGVKTTKRKIIIHKKDCQNVAKISKEKLVEIGFEREKGKTNLRVRVMDRPGIIGEILNAIRAGGAGLITTSFKIKKSGYGEAIFGLEVTSVAKLDKVISEIEQIPGVQNVERI